jgi:ATP synthase protein I
VLIRYNFAALPGGKMLRHLSRPIRTVLQWQVAATAILAFAAAWLAGENGAISAAAGGGISIIAGGAAAWVASRGKAKSAGGVVVGALAAEAVKVGLAILLLGLVLMNWAAVVVPALIGAFVVTIVIFSMAFFVRDY